MVSKKIFAGAATAAAMYAGVAYADPATTAPATTTTAVAPAALTTKAVCDKDAIEAAKNNLKAAKAACETDLKPAVHHHKPKPKAIQTGNGQAQNDNQDNQQNQAPLLGSSGGEMAPPTDSGTSNDFAANLKQLVKDTADANNGSKLPDDCNTSKPAGNDGYTKVKAVQVKIKNTFTPDRNQVLECHGKTLITVVLDGNGKPVKSTVTVGVDRDENTGDGETGLTAIGGFVRNVGEGVGAAAFGIGVASGQTGNHSKTTNNNGDNCTVNVNQGLATVSGNGAGTTNTNCKDGQIGGAFGQDNFGDGQQGGQNSAVNGPNSTQNNNSNMSHDENNNNDHDNNNNNDHDNQGADISPILHYAMTDPVSGYSMADFTRVTVKTIGGHKVDGGYIVAPRLAGLAMG